MRPHKPVDDPVLFFQGLLFGIALALSVVLFFFAEEFVAYMGWGER